MTLEIRLFQAQDAEQVARLFHDTVRAINRQDYSPAQITAWAPEDLHFRHWAEVCASRFTYVAHAAGVILGFGELEANGHIDCFYCHKNYQRQGIGHQIYQAIETKALELRLDRLNVEASITAQPFFQQQGFVVLQKQQVDCRGQTLINYAMEKRLASRQV